MLCSGGLWQTTHCHWSGAGGRASGRSGGREDQDNWQDTWDALRTLQFATPLKGNKTLAAVHCHSSTPPPLLNNTRLVFWGIPDKKDTRNNRDRRYKSDRKGQECKLREQQKRSWLSDGYLWVQLLELLQSFFSFWSIYASGHDHILKALLLSIGSKNYIYNILIQYCESWRGLY